MLSIKTKDILFILCLVVVSHLTHWYFHHRDIDVYEVKMNEEISKEIKHLQYDVAQLYVQNALNFMSIQIHERWRMETIQPERLNLYKGELYEYSNINKREESSSSRHSSSKSD